MLLLELLANLLVASAKIAYGLLAGSLAVAADGVHSLFDGSGNVIALIVMRFASAPPDPEHPYGHAKHEVVAAAVVGMVIAATALQLAWNALDALADGAREPILRPEVGAAVMLVTLAINIGVTLWERRRARELRSPILLADAAHTASDVFVTMGVLATVAASAAGIHWADPVGAMIVVVIVLGVAWKLLRSNLGILVDRAAIDAAEIRTLAETVEGVIGCHRVRSHGPPSAVRVDLHIHVDADMPMRRAHELAHLVEDRLRERFDDIIDVVVHTEPEGDEPESL